jgi:hypothetical protein
MPYGPSCHQIAFSSRQGVDVHNDQCGGATTVKFQLPEESKFGECTLDIHSIDFDCSAGTKHPDQPVSSASEYQPEPTTIAHTVPVPTHEHQPTTVVVDVTSPPAPVHEHHPTTVVVISSPPSPPKPLTTIWATTEVTITKCGPTVTDCPVHSTVVIPSTYTLSTTVCTSETTEISAGHPSLTTALPSAITTSVVTTEVTITKCGPTVTDCPVHSTVVIPSTYTLSTTVCTSETTEISAGHPSLTQAPPSAITTSVATTPVPCPELVPKCLNTWLSIPKCDSNSDAACFCPSSQFTDKVQSCIQAWGSSKQEIDSALSYFAGICAPYVANNPAIVDLVPAPSPTTGPVTHTELRPAGTPCTTLTWSSHTVTVPQVGFNTVTDSSTTSVCLTAGTPASVPVAPPSETGHKEHSLSSSSSSSTTTPCSTHTSTFFTTVAPKTTGIHSTTTKPASEPTETVVHANAGMKTAIGGLWAFGVGLLVLALN